MCKLKMRELKLVTTMPLERAPLCRTAFMTESLARRRTQGPWDPLIEGLRRTASQTVKRMILVLQVIIHRPNNKTLE